MSVYFASPKYQSRILQLSGRHLASNRNTNRYYRLTNSRVVDLTGDSSDIELARASMLGAKKAVKNGARTKAAPRSKAIEISDSLELAIYTIDASELRMWVKFYCRNVETMRSGLEERFLVPGKEAVRYHGDTDSEDDQNSENESSEEVEKEEDNDDNRDSEEDREPRKSLLRMTRWCRGTRNASTPKRISMSLAMIEAITDGIQARTPISEYTAADADFCAKARKS